MVSRYDRGAIEDRQPTYVDQGMLIVDLEKINCGTVIEVEDHDLFIEDRGVVIENRSMLIKDGGVQCRGLRYVESIAVWLVVR